MRRTVLAHSILWFPLFGIGAMVFASDATDPDVRARPAESRGQEQLSRLGQLKSILDDVKFKIDRKREELGVILKKLGTDGNRKLGPEQLETIEFYAELRSELSRVREERSEVELRLKGLTSKAPGAEEKANAPQPLSPPATRTQKFLTRKLKILSTHESLLLEVMENAEEDLLQLDSGSITLELKLRELEGLKPVERKATEEIERTKAELKRLKSN
ncbi:hypothetical protein [Schlesneria sp. DSM 10557]|uniref:hypothetical protein n=1 Tax=Schlesneria sp. DSM 10557 TaxID=3044399 RepID=UPI0035A058BB